MGWGMLKIRLELQEGDATPFVAVNDVTGTIVFRHHDLDGLEALCRKLGWHVVCNTAAYSGIHLPVRS
jgi:hypothetical protein